jgi:8-oxo-dGTP diphosphatase
VLSNQTGSTVTTCRSYVCGFVFSAEQDRILLLRKARPNWQKGKLNGVGGGVEVGERPEQAMVRELQEEVLIAVRPEDCHCFLLLVHQDWVVRFFHIACNPFLARIPADADEYPVVAYTNSLPRDVIPNLRWIVPLALDNTVSRPVVVRDITPFTAEDYAKS